VSKKIKQNRYKPEALKGSDTRSESSTGICLKSVMTIVFIGVLSLLSIFIYDFSTQSSFFNIKRIEISGLNRILKEDLLKFTDLTLGKNILAINLFSIEKQIISHPWIQSARVKRILPSFLSISIIEHEPIAIFRIGNQSDILINTHGKPFKEYNPPKDNINNLPVVAGIELTNANNQYEFAGTLFNSIMDFLHSGDLSTIGQIKADQNTGITIEARDIYNQHPLGEQGIVQIKLGFDNFKAKLNKAKNISEYIDKNFPEKTICAMDLFNIEKVFIKTKINTALYNNLEKGA